MKTQFPTGRSGSAFTLIELLVVMAVIAILAALIFPAGAAIKRKATTNRARAELKLTAAAIEAYKGNRSHYPPDNPGNPAINQLYFELIGTTNFTSTIYHTASGEGMTNVSSFFGPKVTGFVNVSRGSGDDEAQSARNYLPGLKPSEFLEVTNGAGGTAVVLGTIIKGPLMLSDTKEKTINPIRYVSTNPTNNPAAYDLWVDIIVGGKTNRVSNWSEKADVVAY